MGTQRKDISLTDGSGTRLHPLTCVISKQSLPVFDTPMSSYPLSVLMLAGIRQVLTTLPQNEARFRNLLGNGQNWSMGIQNAVHSQPEGMAQTVDLRKGSPNFRQWFGTLLNAPTTASSGQSPKHPCCQTRMRRPAV